MLPLVYFSHAELKNPDDLSVKLDNEEIQTKNNQKLQKNKLILSDDSMNYIGIEDNESPYALGVLDKETGKVRIINTKFFIMKPECYLNATKQQTEEDYKISYSDRLNNLTEAFGSSRKRKAMHTKLKNKLDSDTLDKAVGEAVKVSVEKFKEEETQVKEEPEEGELENISVLPIPNKQAKTPADIYNIEDILISQSEIDTYTQTLASKLLEANVDQLKEWKDNQIYAEYVCDRLKSINTTKNHQVRMKKCKLLAYMSYLIALYKLKPAQIRAKNPFGRITDFPESLSKKFNELYTIQSATSRTMPRRLKDKLTCHIMILGLTIDDFTSDLQSLQKDLKITIQKLSEYYQALGCYIKNHVVTVNNKKIIGKLAILKLPLNEVSLVKGKRKAKKT